VPAQTGGTEYTPGVTQILVETTLNLYARWESDYATIEYVPNDWGLGSTWPVSETIHKRLGTAQGSTATATRRGWEFKHWTDSQGQIVSTERTFVAPKSGSYFAAPNSGSEYVDTRYTAHFGELPYVTIYYMASVGGSVHISSSSVNPEVGEPLRSTAIPDEDYVLLNWTDAQGNVVGTGITFRPTKAQDEVWRDNTTYYANFVPRWALVVINPLGVPNFGGFGLSAGDMPK
jgi:hypothetical protein